MKRGALILLLAVMVLTGYASTVRALSIGFSIDPTYTTADRFSVTDGGDYAVDVVLFGLTGSDIVSAFDLDVLYDSDLLQADSIAFTELLGDSFAFQTLTREDMSTSGLIDFAMVSLLSDAELQDLQNLSGGTITLATLYFTGLSAGTTSLAFDWYEGQDVKGYGNEVIAGYVPEPGTLFLVGTGVSLLAAGGWRRRRNEAPSSETTE